MSFIHLLHKYDWRHVTHTIIQLYMIVSLGIKLKSISVRSWRSASLHLSRKPRMTARLLLKRANLRFVLMQVMPEAYGSLCFLAIFSASLLMTLAHSHTIPPLLL